tara:strand:- start:16975 stop:17400 length:426 start_codon:yes stop_codon:yes gene_type:complete
MLNEKYICLKLSNGENIIAKNPAYTGDLLVIEDPWLYILNNNGQRIVYALVGPWQAFGKIKKGDTVTINPKFIINSYTNIHDTIIDQYNTVVNKEFDDADIYVDTNQEKGYNNNKQKSTSPDKNDLEAFFELLKIDKNKLN